MHNRQYTCSPSNVQQYRFGYKFMHEWRRIERPSPLTLHVFPKVSHKWKEIRPKHAGERSLLVGFIRDGGVLFLSSTVLFRLSFMVSIINPLWADCDICAVPQSDNNNKKSHQYVPVYDNFRLFTMATTRTTIVIIVD